MAELAQTSRPSRRTLHLPRPTALGTLAFIGVLSILAALVASPVLGWRYYQHTQNVALAKTVTDSWAAHWAEAKDAEGNPVTTPQIQNVISYPDKAFLFLYRDPVTDKVAAMAWMSNQELAEAALKDVWVPLAVQEQAPPPK